MEVTPDSFPKLIQGRPASKDSGHDLALREKSKELEAVFLSHLIKVMEKTIPKESSGQSLSTMMFSSIMGDAIAGSGGIGLSEMIYRSLSEEGTSALGKMDDLQENVLPDLSAISGEGGEYE